MLLFLAQDSPLLLLLLLLRPQQWLPLPCYLLRRRPHCLPRAGRHLPLLLLLLLQLLLLRLLGPRAGGRTGGHACRGRRAVWYQPAPAAYIKRAS